MASFLRTILRGMQRRNGERVRMASGAALGSHRAGMHQKAEHEYQHSRMAEAVPPELETVEDGLDMPASVDAEIPPVEEDDDEIVEEIAEGETGVEAETEILEEIADPQAEIEEELPEEESSVLSTRYSAGSGDASRRVGMAVDYSAERIPVMDVITGGIGVDPATPLEYSSQDGSVKEIQEPLPGMSEAYGVAPYVPGMEDPSANVAAYEEPEPEPEPAPEE